MILKKCEIDGVCEIQLDPYTDHRGFFMRTYDKNIFMKYDLHKRWVQENHSFSKQKGTLRGLHFQHSPYMESKLIRIPMGEIFAVYVDLRKDSQYLGKWGSCILSEKKNNMLFIPRGFAMGMCTLTENCSILYKMDNYYHPEKQGEILWDDHDLGIDWPIDKPILSKRDKNAQTYKEFIDEYRGL